MALFKPMRTFVLPFLCTVTIPLAIFAGITTTLAFSVLIFRVMLVYIDLILAFIPQYLSGRNQSIRYVSKSPSTGSKSPSPILTPSTAATRRRRRRRPSSASLNSVGTVTPKGEAGLGLMPSVGMDRDFEGVGGWRLGDDEAWTAINSRLELPDRQYGRNHNRSQSNEPTTPGADGGVLMMKGRNRSPENAMMSPNSSRIRTPSNAPPAFTTRDRDSYFPVIGSYKSVKKVPV